VKRRICFLPSVLATSTMLGACAGAQPAVWSTTAMSRADTVTIAAVARALSADSMRGRGPWTADAERAARLLAARLERLGARPVFGRSLLVPFAADARPGDTVHNVVAVLPNRSGNTNAELVGITAHLDHLGVGQPDASGDSIYNGFLDDAVGMAMVLDVAARYARSPGSRALVVMLFNLEEQRLLGSQAIVERPDAGAVIDRLRLLIGVDAGSPAGEALEWQLMGGLPEHAGARLADSLARVRGWTTTSTAPRAINDVFSFSQRGVPILFPIPGRRWRGHTDEQRTAAMQRFDHYHQPSDEWRADFPWVGTAHFADWLWAIVQGASG
jgi:Zn-dependent M28 family amino/carboxypeptidase